jgi:uncharacterized protein YndB with AHSA1/START domain
MKNNSDHAKFSTSVAIRIVRNLPGPIERIWQYLIDPEKRRRWFAGGPIELRVGGEIELLFNHKTVLPAETSTALYADHHNGGKIMAGTVLRYEPPRVLSYTLGENSDVIFELIPQDDDVLFILTQLRRDHLCDRDCTTDPAPISGEADFTRAPRHRLLRSELRLVRKLGRRAIGAAMGEGVATRDIDGGGGSA